MERGTSPAAARVLLAEDDRSVRDALVMALELEGYEVRATNDGEQALAAFDPFAPDVVVLDVMMPTVDGLTACRRLRSRGIATPILMLTARDQVADRVSGLDAGADDYVIKPFSLDELLARLRALLRRHQPEAGEPELVVGDLHLDPLRRAVRRGDRAIDLTKTEFDLLTLLMEHAGIVLSREQIYEHIWGFDFETGSRSLDVYIGYLRRKTESEGESRLLHPVRGVGYVVRT